MNPPRLLAISSRAALRETAWSEWCRSLARAGVPALQVREKWIDDRELLELADLARLAFPAPGRLLVNGRADVARAVGADGVHLPAHGLPTAAARRALGGSALVGRSTHDLDDVRQARDEGVDYVLFGPVHETPSKLGHLEPRGVSLLADAAGIGVPVLAVGGIDDPARAHAAIAAGAWGVAGIRAFLDAGLTADLVAACREIQDTE